MARATSSTAMNAHGYRIDDDSSSVAAIRRTRSSCAPTPTSPDAAERPREPESVLLGAARSSARSRLVSHSSMLAAMGAMSQADDVIEPDREARVVRYHAAKHRVFQRMYEDQMAYRAMMEKARVAGSSPP